MKVVEPSTVPYCNAYLEDRLEAFPIAESGTVCAQCGSGPFQMIPNASIAPCGQVAVVQLDPTNEPIAPQLSITFGNLQFKLRSIMCYNSGRFLAYARIGESPMFCESDTTSPTHHEVSSFDCTHVHTFRGIRPVMLFYQAEAQHRRSRTGSRKRSRSESPDAPFAKTTH